MSSDWQAFWISWRFDFGLSLLIFLSSLIYLRGWLRLRRRGAGQFGPWQLAAMLGGLWAVYIALQSPLEAFSSLLLQIHMLQHLLLMFIAPPLLWLAKPELPLLVGLPRVLRRSVVAPLLRDEGVRMLTRGLTHPVIAWLLFVAATWIWHLPALYTRALTSTFWHEAEHATFFLAALCFWHVVIAPYPHTRRETRWIVLPFLLLAGLQGTALSALLTFSDRVLYSHYLAVPRIWNTVPLDDQAVAGALMWACGSLIYLVALSLVAVEIWNAPQVALIGAGAKGTLRTGPSLEVIRQSETFGTRPLAKNARWDLLSVPGIGNLLRQAATRRTLQVFLMVAAGLIVLDGLWGPQISPINLAGVLPWIHWRGVLVIGLLVAGNFFCLACPFTLPRNLAKRLLGGNHPWPAFLRSKWLAAGLLVFFFWAYEALALWDSPWWTAWIVVTYFAASFAIDGFFRGASFCKYVCPVGQFQFISSLISPLQIAPRDAQLCATCTTHDCIRGGPQGPGCQTELFVPQKTSNLDCTFCLDCVRACPKDNVGLLAFLPASQLTPTASGTRLVQRNDLAALLLVFCSAAFVNAAWMIAPVVALEQALLQSLTFFNRPLFVGLGIVLTALVLPALGLLAVAALSNTMAPQKESVAALARRYLPALVPLSFALWCAHYAFHLLTSAGTIFAAGNRMLADWQFASLSEAAAACACCGEVAGWILPVEILLLDGGLCLSLFVAYRIAEGQSHSSAATLRAWMPWAVLLIGLFAAAVWILMQPMQMRGTLVLGG
jgi:cytochrome c oxidase assembly factor CtaG/ferredoxin